jgi:serine phosphatase RsbU (regulator of sigma subunit)
MNARRTATAAAVIVGALIALQIFTQGYRMAWVRFLFDSFTLVLSLVLVFRIPPARTVRGEMGRLAFGVLFFALARMSALLIAEQIATGLVLSGRAGWIMLVRPIMMFGMAWNLGSIVRLGGSAWTRRRRSVTVAIALTAALVLFDAPSALRWIAAIYVVLVAAPTNWVEELTGRWGWTALGLLVLAPLAIIVFGADVSVTFPETLLTSRPIGVDSLQVLVESSLLGLITQYMTAYWVMIPLRIAAAFFQGNFGLRIPIGFKLALTYVFSTVIPGLLLLLLLSVTVYLGIGTMRARMVRNLVYADMERLQTALQERSLSQFAPADSVNSGVYLRAVKAPKAPGTPPPPTRIESGFESRSTETTLTTTPSEAEALGEESISRERREYWVKVAETASSWSLPDTLPAFPGWSDSSMVDNGIMPIGHGRAAYAAALVRQPGGRIVNVAMQPLNRRTLERYRDALGVDITLSPYTGFNLSVDSEGDVRASRGNNNEPLWQNVRAVRTQPDSISGFLDRPVYHGVTELQIFSQPGENTLRMVGLISVRTSLKGLFSTLYNSSGVNRVTLLVLVTLSVLLLLAVIFSSVLGFGITRSITSSIAQLRRGTDQLRKGDLDTSIEVRSRDELGDLAKSFNRMTSDLKRMIREVGEKERLEREVQIARQIQLQLLPSQLPETERLKIAARSDPALEVGGDYYDAVDLSDGKVLLALGDVSGKGVGAAILMSNLQANLHVLGQQNLPLEEIASELNRQIWRNSTAEMFITFFLARLECDQLKMTYVNAGHDTPLLLRDGEVTELKEGGLLLGVNPEAIYNAGEIHLRTGDLLACYSDGLTEAMDEHEVEFGVDRMVSTLQDQKEDPAWAIVDGVLRSVRTYAGDERAARDDLTLMIVKVEAGDSEYQ